MSKRNRNNSNIVRMEKRATNKIGLFFLFIIALALFGYGGYYIYIHRNEIDWNIQIPWQKDNSDNTIDDSDSTEDSSSSSSKNNTKNSSSLAVPSMSSQTFNNNNAEITISDIDADDKGYVISASVIATGEYDVEFIITNVLVDGYETETTLSLTNKAQSGISSVSEFRILKTTLDNLNITGFNELTIYYKVNQLDPVSGNVIKEGPINNRKINVTNEIEYDNTLEGLIEMYNKNNTIINYYQTITDNDYTYIYFSVTNQNTANDINLIVKKLLLNDSLYDSSNIETISIYRGASKLFYIAIPRSDIKNIKNITISFFIMLKTTEGDYDSVYITNEYSRNI